MMRVQALPISRSAIRVILMLMLALVVSDLRHALAQQACPPNPDGSRPADLRVSAQQVEENSASLKEFVLSARDRYGALAEKFVTLEGLARFGCLAKQDLSRSPSRSTYIVALTPDGRVLFHSKDMSLAGRGINPFVYFEILSALGTSPTDLVGLLSSDPSVRMQAFNSVFEVISLQQDGPFDATTALPGIRPAIPGVSGHAAAFFPTNRGMPQLVSGTASSPYARVPPLILLGGFDLNESHLIHEVIDYGDPAITAKDVVDRETLKAFVAEALNFIVDSFASGPRALAHLRLALRDPNGPWRHGPVYVYALDRNSKIILSHGAFPDRYEFQPLVVTVRDVVTGKLVIPQLLEAAASNPEGGFVEYYFDDPTDDTDRADIPKVGYAREYVDDLLNLVVGSGFYLDSPAGTPTTTGCSDRNVAASAVRDRSHVQAFVECAAQYLAEHGTGEARRAFNEDERWKHGPTYVFVDGIGLSGADSKTFVYPPDPAREGTYWGEAIGDFGTDLFSELHRMMAAVDSGWTYYSFPNPQTGKKNAKASYVIEVDWDGERAVIGSGIYERDLPGTCYPDEVSAAKLAANPNRESLREFVRCAAMVVEEQGYHAKEELLTDPQWSDGTHYVYVLDTTGYQVMTGNRVALNGKRMHEWGRGGAYSGQFGGRDLAAAGDAFGEAYYYYSGHHPQTGALTPKVGFLKRVVAQGVPLLVGAGYFIEANRPATGLSCAENHANAAGVHTRSDVQAFVQCAAEYVQVHGEEEARRAFNEDERWRSGETYVFVDGLAMFGEEAVSHVFPPDPAREGRVWGNSIDGFGSDYFFELHRILSLVDEGWIYYAFTNPETGRWEPKSSYVIEIDWNGERVAVGAGVYRRDLPGSCDPDEVNAWNLAASADDRALQEFVRCAAMRAESAGYFAGPELSEDPRWNSGPIYVFGINAETGMVEFSGNPESFKLSGRIPELLFEGRDLIQAGAFYGEMFSYYRLNNPETGQDATKVSFTKRVQAQGVPLLIGAGYNP